MRMTALQTIKLNGVYVTPGTDFDIDGDEAKKLVKSGAATKAPDPDAVGAAAKTAKRP